MARQRKDAEGDFLRKSLGPDFFPTSAGYMECVSAGGKRLGGGNLKKVLEAFHKLPQGERKPGAVKVAALGAVDTAVASPQPPPGGLIVKLYGRLMSRETDGPIRKAHLKDFPLLKGYQPDSAGRVGYLFEAHTDFLWLTQAEWQALVPIHPKKGDTLAISPAIVQRICRYHLVPERIYGEGGGWGAKGIRAAKLTLTVVAVTSDAVRFQLHGFAHLGSVYDPAKATTPNGPLPIGYEANLDGILIYDTGKKAFTRFDAVALGDVWGRMGDANGKSVSVERPGRHPLAFAFELVRGDRPADRLTPTGRASKVRSGYFTIGK